MVILDFQTQTEWNRNQKNVCVCVIKRRIRKENEISLYNCFVSAMHTSRSVIDFDIIMRLVYKERKITLFFFFHLFCCVCSPVVHCLFFHSIFGHQIFGFFFVCVRTVCGACLNQFNNNTEACVKNLTTGYTFGVLCWRNQISHRRTEGIRTNIFTVANELRRLSYLFSHILFRTHSSSMLQCLFIF